MRDEGGGRIRLAGEQAEDDGRDVAYRHGNLGRWNQGAWLHRGEVDTQRIEPTTQSSQQRLGGGMFEGSSPHGAQRRMQAQSATDHARHEATKDGGAVLAARNAGRGQQRDRAAGRSADEPLDPNPLDGLWIGLDGRALVEAVSAQSMAIRAERAAQRPAGE